MIEPGSGVVAGVSGGADSVCLLLVLKELSEEMNFFLHAVYVEHGIRGESSVADGQFVCRLCEIQHIPFHQCSVDSMAEAEQQHMSLEEAARKLRYEALERIRRQVGADRIAVAHHAEDSAETMLFHLARGTGIHGLVGIRPVRGAVIRPLLCVSREEIEAWLAERGQPFVQDETNEDLAYARNRIRRKVLPELTQINGKAVEHIMQASELLEETESFLQDSLNRVMRQIQLSDGCAVIPRRVFADLHPLMQKELVHELLGRIAGSRKDITGAHIDAVRGLFSMQSGRRVDLPYRMRAEAESDRVRIFQRNAPEPEQVEDFCVDLKIPGYTELPDGGCLVADLALYDGQKGKIPDKAYTKWLDYDTINTNVQVRFRRAGDYLIVGNPPGHKKLKDYLIDEKIPRRERSRLILVAAGPHVLWVAGGRISEDCKITEHTKRVLKLEMYRGAANDRKN